MQNEPIPTMIPDDYAAEERAYQWASEGLCLSCGSDNPNHTGHCESCLNIAFDLPEADEDERRWAESQLPDHIAYARDTPFEGPR